MARSTTRAKHTAKVARARGRKTAREVRGFGEASGEIVRAAAHLLDQEMAVGIAAAKAMQQRLQKERRIDSADFNEAVQRLHTDARNLIKAVGHQIDGSRLTQNSELAKQFLAKTNDLLDLVVGVVITGAELANQMLQTNLQSEEPRRGRKSRS